MARYTRSMTDLNRRQFVAASGVALAASMAGASRAQTQPPAAAKEPAPKSSAPGDSHRGRVVISSGNGLEAVKRAAELAASGTYLLDALVAGVKIVEDDPND